MPRKNWCYKVESVGSGLRKSYPLNEVKANTIIKLLESAPQGSLDVIDVKLPNGKVKNVYSFQLNKPVKCPTKLKKKSNSAKEIADEIRAESNRKAYAKQRKAANRIRKKL